MRVLYKHFFAISVADHQVQIDFIPSGEPLVSVCPSAAWKSNQSEPARDENLSHLNILLPLYSVGSYVLELRAEELFGKLGTTNKTGLSN